MMPTFGKLFVSLLLIGALWWIKRMFQRRFDVTILFTISSTHFSLLRVAIKIIDYFLILQFIVDLYVL